MKERNYMNTNEQIVRDIIASHLECELTEENGWNPEIIEYLESLIEKDFKIEFINKED